MPFKANLVCVMGKKNAWLWYLICMVMSLTFDWSSAAMDETAHSILFSWGKKISTKYKVLPWRQNCRKCMLIWRLNISQALCACSYVYVSLYSWMVLSSTREKKNIKCDMYFCDIINVTCEHVWFTLFQILSSCSLLYGHQDTCEDILLFFLLSPR